MRLKCWRRIGKRHRLRIPINCSNRTFFILIDSTSIGVPMVGEPVLAEGKRKRGKRQTEIEETRWDTLWLSRANSGMSRFVTTSDQRSIFRHWTRGINLQDPLRFVAPGWRPGVFRHISARTSLPIRSRSAAEEMRRRSCLFGMLIIGSRAFVLAHYCISLTI